MPKDDRTKEELEKALDELDLYTKLLRKEPRLVRAWLGKGSALSRLGKFTESVKCFDRALQLDGENEEAMRKKARVLRFAGKSDDAGRLDAVIAERFGKKRGKAVKKEEQRLLDDISAIGAQLGIPQESAEKLAKDAGKRAKPRRSGAGRSPRVRRQSARRKLSAKTGDLVETFKAIEEKLEIKPQSAVNIWGEIASAVEQMNEAETELSSKGETGTEAEEETGEKGADEAEDEEEALRADIEEETAPILEEDRMEAMPILEEDRTEAAPTLEGDRKDAVPIFEEDGKEKVPTPAVAIAVLPEEPEGKEAVAAEPATSTEITVAVEKKEEKEEEVKAEPAESPATIPLPVAEQPPAELRPSPRTPSPAPDARRTTGERKTGPVYGRRDMGMVNGLGSLPDGLRRTPRRAAARHPGGLINGMAVSGGARQAAGRTGVHKTGQTNGLINGRIGKAGYVNGSYCQKKLADRRKRNGILQAVAVTTIVIGFVLSALILYIPVREEGKLIGEFDWSAEQVYASTGNAPDNVNIEKYGAESGHGRISFYIKVTGTMLAGEPAGGMNRTDTVHIFVDSDRNSGTGYRIGGLGADYLLRISGRGGKVAGSCLFMYDSDRDGSGIDWNAWSEFGTVRSAVRGGELEAQVSSYLVGMRSGESADVLFHALGWDGSEAFSDGIAGTSPKDGMLVVRQLGISDPVVGTGARIGFLRMELQAMGADISMKSIAFTRVGDAQPWSVKLEVGGESYPAVPAGSRYIVNLSRVIAKNDVLVAELVANTGGLSPCSTLGFMIGDRNDIAVGNGAVTLRSSLEGYVAYTGSAPKNIRIDSAFGDWTGVENSGQGNVNDPNIDIARYAARNEGGSLFFYLRVDGEVLGGTKVPWRNPARTDGQAPTPKVDSDRDTVPDDADPMPLDFNNDGIPDSDTNHDADGDGKKDYPYGGGQWWQQDCYLNTTIPSNFTHPYAGKFVSVYIGKSAVSPATEVPKVTGEDCAFIFIDSDNDSSTGYAVSSIGADFLVNITGKNGGITGRTLNAFGCLSRSEWKWTVLNGTVSAGKDTKQMEVGIDTGIIGSSGNASIVFMTRDWKNENDSTAWTHADFEEPSSEMAVRAIDYEDGLQNAATETLGDAGVIRNPKIKLNNVVFDPIKEKPRIPSGLCMAASSNFWLVQLRGPTQPSWLQKIKEIGGKIFSYIPDYTYVVRIDSDINVNKIRELPFVRYVGENQPAYKIQKGLLSGDAGYKFVDIQVYENLQGVTNLVKSMEGQVVYASGTMIRALVNLSRIQNIAFIPEVEWIQAIPVRILCNDLSADSKRLNASPVWTAPYLLNGTGQIVAVCDTGLDTGNLGTLHLDFKGRVLKTYALGRPGDWSDDNSHGTHVTGSVLGNGTRSSGQFKGMAYGAQLVFQSVLDSGGGLGGIPIDLHNLYQPTYNDGARIHTNSWGAANAGQYDTDSQNTDDFTWNNRDFLILYAAGNEGKDRNPGSDGIVNPDSINTPGTAKNVLTVGAVENERNTGGYQYTWNQAWPLDFPTNPVGGDHLSDSSEGMVAFSSRGPCDDGRIKPDVVAPGTNIISTRSQDPAAGTGWGIYDQYYLYMGGTSMATPLVAGCAALVRQYYSAYRSLSSPSAALVKATLINGATDITGQYDNPKNDAGPIPNNSEGWGRVNVKNSIFPDAPRSVQFRDITSGFTASSQMNTYTYRVGTGAPLKITLAWNDYRGSPVSGGLVNNLNLRVTAPGGSTYWYGNDFTSGWSDTSHIYDNVNNVECVYIQTPQFGIYTVDVIAQNIASLGTMTDQDYALVVSGEFVYGNDAKTISVNAPKSQSPNTIATITSTIMNYGTNAILSPFNVRCRITDPTSVEVYNSVQQVLSLASLGTATQTWTYTPPTHGIYTVTVTTELTGDENITNDGMSDTMIVIPRLMVHPEVNVDGAISDWTGTPPISDNTWVANVNEYVWKDAAGDDKGDGDYTYPTNAKWEAGCLDLIEFRLCGDTNSLNFLVKFSSIDNNPAAPRGFGEQMIMILMDQDTDGTGRTDTLMNAKVKLPVSNAWEYMVWANGYGNGRLVSEAGVSSNVLTVQGSAATDCVEISVPYANIGGPPQLEKWRFTVLTGAEDGANGFLDVNRAQSANNGGGGYDGGYPDPNAYDLAFVGTLAEQDAILNNYDQTVIQYTAGWDGIYGIYKNEWIADDFTITSPKNLDRVSVEIADVGTNDQVTMEIRRDSSGRPGMAGGDLIDSLNSNSDATLAWVDFVFSPAQLLAAGRYWICLENNANNIDNGYGWEMNEGTGSVAISTNQGGSWGLGTYSAHFKAYLYDSAAYATVDRYQDVIFNIRSVVINEVASFGTGNAEWIELYNNASIQINMNGWSLSDQDGNTFIFGTNCPVFTANAGQYIVVYTSNGIDDLTVNMGSLPNAWEEYWDKAVGANVWGDAGDDVLLYDGTVAVDYMAYDLNAGADEIDAPPFTKMWKNTGSDAGSGYGGQAPCPGSGQSVSLIPNGWDRDRAKDWFLGEATPNPPGAPAKITKGEENVIPEIPPAVKPVLAFSPVLVLLIARPVIKWRHRKKKISLENAVIKKMVS